MNIYDKKNDRLGAIMSNRKMGRNKGFINKIQRSLKIQRDKIDKSSGFQNFINWIFRKGIT